MERCRVFILFYFILFGRHGDCSLCLTQIQSSVNMIIMMVADMCPFEPLSKLVHDEVADDEPPAKSMMVCFLPRFLAISASLKGYLSLGLHRPPPR